MLNDRTKGPLIATRPSGASTPLLTPGSARSEFLRQEDCLCFGHGKEYYSHLLEEKDDDILRWYPMYISYSHRERALAVNEALTSKGYDTYLHLQEVPKDPFGNPIEGSLLGPIYNMVFVYAMKIQLKMLKRYAANCNVMKFMMEQHRFADIGTSVIWVPDRQMQNFRDAATRPDPESQRIPLTYNDFINKQGRHVRIMSGPFTGIEGEIKRIGRHRIVVALLREAMVAIGITHVPPENLIFI